MAVVIEMATLDGRLARIPARRRGHLLLLERANARPAPLRPWRAEGARLLAWWVAGMLGIALWAGLLVAADRLLTALGLRA